MSENFQLSTLRRDLKPFHLHWFPRLRSTNDHAAALRKREELFAPAVVLTGHQLAGRGRGSNTWWSGPGTLTVTFVFPSDEHLAPYHIPLIAGLAVRAACAELTGNDNIQLKWPNDLLFNGKKLAGLLCERVYKVDLIGIGLNINLSTREIPKQLKERIISLNAIADRDFEMTAALIVLSKHLHRLLSHRDEQSFVSLLREYDSHHALLGKRVTVTGSTEEPRITGKCEGLDDMGRLLLRDRKTLHRVIAGHVEAV